MPKRKRLLASDYRDYAQIKKYAAGAAGGMLGFITADVPGAIAGARTGYNLAESSSVVAPKKVMARKITARRGSSSAKPGNQIVQKKTKQVKGVSYKPKRNVKVSRVFKDKVMKAIEKNTVHGFAQQVSYGGMLISGIGSNAQLAMPILGAGGPLNADYSPYDFDPEFWLHHASVMYGGIAAVSQTAQSWQQAGTIGAKTTGIINAKLHIDYSKSVYQIRNNSQRTLHIKLYDCAPRNMGGKASSVPQLGGGSGASADWMRPPDVAWQQFLAQDTNNEINAYNISTSFLGLSPLAQEQWIKHWKAEVTTIVLQPGQTVNHVVNGPSNFDVDFSNLFRGGQYMGVQKFMRYQMLVVHNDLVAPSSTVAWTPTTIGRLTSATETFEGLIIERKQIVKFQLPEQTISADKTGLASTQNFARIRKYGRVNFGLLTGPTGPLGRVDVENPATIEVV